MKNLTYFVFAFAIGVVLGGGVRMSVVKAQLKEVAPLENFSAPAPGGSLNMGRGGGSCG